MLLLGVFPRGPKPDATREKLQEVNRQIAQLDDGSHVTYLDIGNAFLSPDNIAVSGNHAGLSSPECTRLPALGRRHGAHALAAAR